MKKRELRWKDYRLLDAGEGEKRERWGDYVLVRPDPQAIWPHPAWPKPDARYHRSSEGGGQWQNSRVPEHWQVSYPGLAGDLRFQVSLMGFKHTGLFPEQSANWDFVQKQILEARKKDPKREIRVLNLFAYSGAATLACAAAGATEVVHVDASKRMNNLAKENARLSGLEDRYIRYIAEDVNRFVEREARRGRRYEGIIMDPPAYGRGPSGELWKLETAVCPLVEAAAALLSDSPLFFVLNTYTTGLTPGALESILRLGVAETRGGEIEAVELVLPADERDIVLPCGCTGRWRP